MSLATVFGADLLIVFVVFVCAFLVPIWAVAVAAVRPAAASYGAGSNKTTWIVVMIVAWFFGLGSSSAASTCSSRGRRSAGSWRGWSEGAVRPTHAGRPASTRAARSVSGSASAAGSGVARASRSASSASP